MQNETTNNPTSPLNATFKRLRELKRQCGRNKNDQATALIGGCILEEMDTRRRIVGALEMLGLNPNHVVSILNSETGVLWVKDADGRYTLCPDDAPSV